MSGAYLFVLVNGLAILVSLALSEWGFRGRESWRRGFGALAAFPIVCVGSLIAANAISGLRASTLLGVLAILAILAGAGLVRARRSGPPIPAAPPAATPADPGGADALRLIALGLSGGLLAAWTGRTLLGGTRFVWDDLTYHATLPAWWLTSESLSLGALTFQAYYPLNAELFSLWFLSALGSDAFASAAVFFWGVLAASAVAILVRALAGPGPATGLVVAVLLGSNVVWNRGNTFSATDLASAACLLAAIAFSLPRVRGFGSARDTGASDDCIDAFATGALAGFAAGCKVFYLPAALLVGAVLARRALRRDLRRAWRPIGSFAVALALTGSAWYVRNWIHSGNPIFPASWTFFDGPFGADAQASTQLAARIAASPFDLEMWRSVLVSRANWPPSLAVVSAIGGIGALGFAGRNRSANDSLEAVRSMLLLAGGCMLLVYPFLPFSATGNRPDIPMHTGYLRFLILPFAAGIALFGHRLRHDSGSPALWGAATVLAVAAAWQLPALQSVTAFGSGVALMALRGPVRERLRGVSTSPLRGFAACCVALIALGLWTPMKQRATDENLFAYRAKWGPIGDAWRSLEGLPDGSRIAFFMSEPLEYTQFYPIFGRRLQFTPVAVNADGTPRRPLHETWRGDGTWWSSWETRKDPVDAAALARNLRASGAEYALVTQWSLGGWPPQYEALRELPGVALYDDEYSVLFRLAP